MYTNTLNTFHALSQNEHDNISIKYYAQVTFEHIYT